MIVRARIVRNLESLDWADSSRVMDRAKITAPRCLLNRSLLLVRTMR